MKTQNQLSNCFISIAKRYLHRLNFDLRLPNELLILIVTYLPIRSFYERLFSKTLQVRTISVGFGFVHTTILIRISEYQDYTITIWQSQCVSVSICSNDILIKRQNKQKRLYFMYDNKYNLHEIRIYDNLNSFISINQMLRDITWEFTNDGSFQLTLKRK